MIRRSTWVMGLSGSLLALIVGCGGSSSNTEDRVLVTVNGGYEKRSLGPTGLGNVVVKPARYAFVEAINASTGNLLSNADLNANGIGTLEVPRGVNTYVVMYADVLIPGNQGTFLRGVVNKGIPAPSYTQTSVLNNLPLWTTSSDTFSANTDGALSLIALENTNEAGAFAIADQMATFGLQLQTLQPTLTLPVLHTFWNAGTGTTYPTVVTDPQGNPLLDSNRSILQHEVQFPTSTVPDLRAGAYNDSVLQEVFARGLFAAGLIRQDNDNAYVAHKDASEASIAFMGGFGTFLSCAFRNSPSFFDVSSNGTVSEFRLDEHGGYTPTGGGEFYAGSIARNLWGIWTNPNLFNGSFAGLQTMWNATDYSIANQAYEFGTAPLACHPTYLTALRRLGGFSFNLAFSNELALESIPDPTQGNYFNLNTLWLTPLTLPQSGTLDTSACAQGYFFDQNQSQAYRIVHSGGPRTVTLSTATSPGLLVELIGAKAYKTATAKATQTAVIDATNLEAGTYVVRVRVIPYPATAYNGSPASYTMNTW